ncbi:NAD(P)-binding protein [Coprinopsis sp. MPI-PUGE-AT-0042]|nr:NAD(P)-binding protein [Coprinopsis sp. MPI-PUGE-AT-0042]
MTGLIEYDQSPTMTITQSQDAPLVVVGGATGNQGGSVIRFLAGSPKAYRIRALTRDVTKPKARKLADQGVEVVSVNLTPENKAKIVQAYTGADIVFSVTNFWEHLDYQREIDEGKAMIDAGIEAGVKLFIFSPLPSVKKNSNGKYSNVYHFEGKAVINDYGKSKNSNTFKYRAVHAGLYNSNMLGQQITKKDPLSGKWSLKLPFNKDHLVPSIDIDDYGLWVRALIENKAVQDDTRDILSAGEWVSMDHIVKAIEKKAGTSIAYEQVDIETFKKTLPDSMPPHIVTDLAENWAAFDEFGYYGGEDTDWILPYLSQKPSTFAEWAEKTDLSEYSG